MIFCINFTCILVNATSLILEKTGLELLKINKTKQQIHNIFVHILIDFLIIVECLIEFVYLLFCMIVRLTFESNIENLLHQENVILVNISVLKFIFFVWIEQIHLLVIKFLLVLLKFRTRRNSNHWFKDGWIDFLKGLHLIIKFKWWF